MGIQLKSRGVRIAALIGGLALLVGGVVIYASSRTATLVVSPATTYLTGPLTHDGMVDYTAAINSRPSAGVAPEDNAAVT